VSCGKNGQRCADAAKLNGINGQISRYLNTLGNLSTYRDLNNVEEVPQRIAEVTAAYFGIKGLIEGHPKVAGVLGVIIGLHFLEQVTGGVATTAVRLYGRGRPIAQYRGMILRQSPFTPKKAKLLNTLTGGRVLDSHGYYFFSNGRTWHCQSITVQVGDMPRTLTKIETYSIPHREFYFDRPVYVQGIDPDPIAGDRVISMQRVVDMVLGDEAPDAIPGFIGSVNEFEDAVSALGQLKRGFFLTNWLLVDPGERDGGGMTYVDYEAFAKGLPPGGAAVKAEDGYYKVHKEQPTLRPVSPTARYPSTSTPPDPVPPAPKHYGANYFGSKPAATVPIPLSSIQGRYQVGDKLYPLIVKGVVPLGNNPDLRRANAAYYDDEIKQWREVVNDNDRETIARLVAQGSLSLTDKSLWPEYQTYY